MTQNEDKAQFNVFDASSYKIGIVVAQFNRSFCEAMLESALSECTRYSISESNVDIFRVAGSVEIPVILSKLASTKKYDCLVAIGVIMRGSTAHFDYVAKFATDGILRVQLDNNMPIGFAVLTVENSDQAHARIHVGKEATEAALQSAKIIKSIK